MSVDLENLGLNGQNYVSGARTGQEADELIERRFQAAGSFPRDAGGAAIQQVVEQPTRIRGVVRRELPSFPPKESRLSYWTGDDVFADRSHLY